MNYYSVLNGLEEKYSLVAMRLMNAQNWRLHAGINERAALAQYDLGDGTMWVRVYSMDCDCVEGVTYRRMPCSWWALEKARMEQDKWAEGPCSIIPDYEEGESMSRDRVLEAYENGRSFSV